MNLANLLLPILSLLPGIAWLVASNQCEVIRNWLIQYDPVSFAGTAASFAFTVMGFLTAVLSVIIALSSSRTLQRYREKGHFSTFLVLYGVTAAVLFLLFILSMALYGSKSIVLLSVVQSLMLTGIFQFGFFIIIVLNLCRLKMRERTIESV